MVNYIKNSVVLEDLQQIAENEILNELRDNSAVLVTGATGLIGSLIVKALAYHNKLKGKSVKIIALVRNTEKAQAVFGNMIDDGLISLAHGDVTSPLKIEEDIDYIIHGASATSSRFFVEKPVETIFTALSGTKNVLELAKEKNVKKVVYLSSLEVYGVPDGSKEYISEKDFGYIDPVQVRSSYSEGKRMAECICASYASEYGVPVAIARLSQTFGAGVSYDDGRVFAEFARCAIEERDIVLHTEGRTVRTYCYTTDAINAIFAIMLRGTAGEAYNVTNMDTAISIREMGELVCSLTDGKIRVKIEIPENVASFGYNPEMVIRLDSRKLQETGWKPAVSLKEMYERLIAGMKLG